MNRISFYLSIIIIILITACTSAEFDMFMNALNNSLNDLNSSQNYYETVDSNTNTYYNSYDYTTDYYDYYEPSPDDVMVDKPYEYNY